MPQWFECPHLGVQVELTDEREGHIRAKHGDLIAEGFERIAEVLEDPQLIRRDRHAPDTLKFSRWYDDGNHRRHAVVVVVTDLGPPARSWIVTAFPAGEYQKVT